MTQGGRDINASHTISTTVPINVFNLADLGTCSHLVGGGSGNHLTIYFKDQAARQADPYMAVEYPD